MGRYILKRLLIMIPTLLAVAILIFTLMACVPGDPVDIAIGSDATQEQKDALRETLGLNDPFLTRMGKYLGGIITRFDFGLSFQSRRPVINELKSRFPNTLILAFLCVVVCMVVGIPIGVRSAVKANHFEDRLYMFLTMLFNSMPNFFLALLLVLVFSVWLNILPSSGNRSLKYFILPVVSNSAGAIAAIARQTRSSMLEVIRSDYVTMARSKGLAERKVIYGHALPNALIPIITVVGSMFAMMLGGTMITETIFGIPGLGTYLITGVNGRDYNVVQACVLYIAAIFAVVMLITDLVYAFVDPRIKAQYAGAKRKAKKKEEAEA